MSRHRFAIYDAFTDKSLGGSPAGLVADASELSTDQMLRVAREVAAPATCFVLCVEGSRVDARFFSTLTEYGMCGHGTISLMTWLVDTGQISVGTTGTSVTLRTPTSSADVDLTLTPDQKVEIMVHLDPAPSLAIDVDPSVLARCLGITTDAFNPSLPMASSSSDFGHLLVPIRDLESMIAIDPDFSALTGLSRELGVDTVAAFSTETQMPISTIHCRDFCPAVGTAEAAATGTTNRALACYLYDHGLLRPDVTGEVLMISEQGYELQRASEVTTKLTIVDGQVSAVRVGGLAACSVDGHIHIDS